MSVHARTHRWVLVLVAATSVAHADARDHVRAGVALYERGAFDAAIAELERANAIEVTAEGCYALGQAWRKKGDCTRAIASYRCAVESAPTEEFERAANFQIGRCVVEGRLEPDVNPEPILIPVDRVVVKPAPPSPWYRDTAGGVLFGLGIGAVSGGGGLLVHAELRAQAAGGDLQAFRDADNVRTERLAGTVSLAIGGALLVGSIVRYAVVAR